MIKLSESKGKDKYSHLEKDEDVDEMLRTWDIVKCGYCGKKISMLKAKIVKNYEGYEMFVCRNH